MQRRRICTDAGFAAGVGRDRRRTSRATTVSRFTGVSGQVMSSATIRTSPSLREPQRIRLVIHFGECELDLVVPGVDGEPAPDELLARGAENRGGRGRHRRDKGPARRRGSASSGQDTQLSNHFPSLTRPV
jgi:hypothetical protein